MTDPMDEPSPEYELAMPFVICKSNGGTYEDQPFVAGWRLGALDARMGVATTIDSLPQPTFVQAADIPQVELLAMKHGYLMTTDDSDDEWTHITFEWPEARI